MAPKKSRLKKSRITFSKLLQLLSICIVSRCNSSYVFVEFNKDNHGKIKGKKLVSRNNGSGQELIFDKF
jgi:Ca2+-binding EF-hand superfamily protein